MNLSYGMRGPAVTKLQGWLNRAMPDLIPGPAVDGIFGPSTQTYVKEFQSRAGLSPDGIVGPQTLAALSNALRMSLSFTAAELAQTTVPNATTPSQGDVPASSPGGAKKWLLIAVAVGLGLWVL